MNHPGYRMDEVARVVGGTLHGPEPHAVVEHLAIDSRKALPRSGVLFVAVKGERHDGHRYLSELSAHGVRCFLVQEVPDGIEGTFVQVSDTLDALRRLAAWHRGRFQCVDGRESAAGAGRNRPRPQHGRPG